MSTGTPTHTRTGETHAETIPAKTLTMQMLGCQGKLEDDELLHWRDKGKAMAEMLLAECRNRGVTANQAPDVPPGVEEGFTCGPFRVLYHYSLINVIGHDGPDDDQQPIYGPPCWLIRVDTLAE